jgi:LPS sulfotransferase NodH
MENKDPVFLCGALRSGSTVLGLMLRYHPQIIAPGEFDFLFDCVGENGEFPQTEFYLDWLVESRIFQAHNLTTDSSASFKQNIDSFVVQMSKPGQLLSLNVHRNFQRIPYLFPNARYIHLIRDARDVARSSIGMGWSGNVYYGVDHWIKTENSWGKVKSVLNEDQYIEIKFEELITDSKEVLTNICKFLGVEYSNQMLEYPSETTYSKPDISLIRQWERKQSKKQIQLIEYKVAQAMTSCGYTLSGYPIIKPGFMDKVWLYLQNRLYRMRFGIRHFGAGLYFAEKLTRFPILNRWHSDCVLKMNKLELKLLK